MDASEIPLDQVIEGDCLEVMAQFPPDSFDLIFADPPYNLQLRQDLWRPNLTRVEAVTDAWDQFSGFDEYKPTYNFLPGMESKSITLLAVKTRRKNIDIYVVI